MLCVRVAVHSSPLMCRIPSHELHHNLFMYSTVNGHLSYFQYLVIINSAMTVLVGLINHLLLLGMYLE